MRAAIASSETCTMNEKKLSPGGVTFQETRPARPTAERPGRGEIAGLLRGRGNRITPQRRAILAIIEDHRGHLGADEIYYLARREVPRLSLSTVYRTLDLLKGLDLVSELHLAGDHYRYEAQSGEHQHLVCVSCGQVIEFQCGYYHTVHEKLASEYGFRIAGSRVELFGYCEECSKAQRNGETCAVSPAIPISGEVIR
jgi:Fe2+ or Zn2+ uptake regulation protein